MMFLKNLYQRLSQKLFQKLPEKLPEKLRAKLPDKFPMTKNRWLVVICSISTLLAVILVLAAPKPDKKLLAETAWPVTVIEAKEETLSPEVTLYGRVETPRTSTLTSSVKAYVSSVHVREGDWVREGDLLIQFDQVDSALLVERRQADLEEAEAKLKSLTLRGRKDNEILQHEQALFELLGKKVARYKKLRQDRSISEETRNTILMESHQQAIALSRQKSLVEDFEHQMSRSKASLKRFTALLNESMVQLLRNSIRAPFTGRITTVNVSPGELVSPGSVVTQLYDEEHMEIRAQIPTALLSSIKKSLNAGTPLEAEIRLRNKTIRAKLQRLSGKVNTGRSSVDGLFELTDDAILELGRAVDIGLKLPAVDQAVKIPVQSIYGHDRVFVIQDSRLSGVEVVRMGEFKDQAGEHHILIRSPDISAGTQVLTSQLSNAITGLKVSVRKTPSQVVKSLVGDLSNG